MVYLTMNGFLNPEKFLDVNITSILNVTVHTRVPSNDFADAHSNRQNLLPELYRTEFSVQKFLPVVMPLLNLTMRLAVRCTTTNESSGRRIE